MDSATGLYGQGNNALTTNYTKALQPFQTNYNTAQGGVNALGDVLGLNGPAGSNSAMTALQATPGYQFALGQGDNSINAAAAANGTLGSGNQLTALSKFNSGLASQNYNNYVSQLQPYLSASQGAASGIGSLYSGLGSALNSNATGLGNLNMNANVGMGNAQASADLADQSLGMNLLGGGLKLGASLLPMMFSDERLKEDIEPVGELYDGQSIYRYRYKGDDTPRIGLMAQEVAETNPGAVGEFGGFLAVDYQTATNAAADLAKFLRAP